MKYNLKVKLLILSVVIMMPAMGWAATYEVNEGESINDAVHILQPGDTLQVREGVYRESIVMRVKGLKDNRITIKNYPGEHPVIDGSEILTGWRKCESQEACGGNPNWQNIYYAFAPPETETFTANLYQDNELLAVSQYPNPSNPFYYDNHLYDYLVVPNAASSATSITDSRLAGLGGTALIGSYIGYWNFTSNITFRKISDYDDSATPRIIFNDLGEDERTQGNETHYTILNNLGAAILDRAGEYYFNETPESTNGRHKIYLWPLNNQDLENEGEVTVSLRTELFNFNGNDYITLDGLKFEKGIGRVIRSRSQNTGNILKNLEVSKSRTNVALQTIRMEYSSNILIENNYIHHSAGPLRGIHVGPNSNNVIVRNNTLANVMGTNIYFTGVSNGQIIYNSISDSNGLHGNGISVYQGSNNVLVAGNYVIRSDNACTVSASSNITIYNNIFFSDSIIMAVANQQADLSGTIALLNNIVIGSRTNTAFEFKSGNVININNIIDGDPGWQHENVRSNNVYTSLNWRQQASQGWEMEQESFLEEDLTVLFNDPSNYDLITKDGSPLIDNGTDVSPYLIQAKLDYPEYDFEKDIAGNPRVSGSNWDIGPYEYGADGTGPNLEPDPQPEPEPESGSETEQEIGEDAVNNIPDKTLLRISNNIIKSGGNSAVTINCDVKEAGKLTVKIYDSKGKEIIVLWNKHEEPGTVPITWLGEDNSNNKVGSGIYMVHMKSGSYSKTAKIAVVK